MEFVRQIRPVNKKARPVFCFAPEYPLSSTQNPMVNKKRLAILTILGLLVVVTCLPLVGPRSASASAMPPAPTISLSYQMSQTQIFVTVSSSDSQFPSQVMVTLASSYNGTSSPYNVQNVVVPSICGRVTVTFSVPYSGQGDYTFSATVKTTSGTLLLQTTLDPRIDPDWH